MSSCGDCGRMIIWARTDQGKAMPLDPEKVLGGNVVLTRGLEPWHGGVRAVDRASVIKPDPAVEAYVHHAVSCPTRRRQRNAKRALPPRKRH